MVCVWFRGVLIKDWENYATLNLIRLAGAKIRKNFARSGMLVERSIPIQPRALDLRSFTKAEIADFMLAL